MIRLKELVDCLGVFLADYLHGKGFHPEVIPRETVGDIIWTEWGGQEEGKILVLCHLDTVWDSGSLKKNPFENLLFHPIV